MNQNRIGRPLIVVITVADFFDLVKKAQIAVHFTMSFTVVRASLLTRGQSNLTKSASRGAHSPVRGHPRGSKVVPLNSWGRVSY